MDAEIARKKRLEEIEEKKKRLARMREEKKLHSAATQVHSTPHLPLNRRPNAPEPPAPKTQEELEEKKRKKEEETHKIVAELLPPDASPHSPTRHSAQAMRKSKEEMIASFTTVAGNPVQILPRRKNTVDKGEQTEDDDLLFLPGRSEDDDGSSDENSVQIVSESKDMHDMSNIGLGIDGGMRALRYRT